MNADSDLLDPNAQRFHPSRAPSKNPVLDPSVHSFLHGAVRSVSALELLIFLRGHPGRTWRADELVRELRSSATAVGNALTAFEAAGLVRVDAQEDFAYRPVAPELDRLVEKLQTLYREKRIAVINAIFSQPGDPLRDFADAFRLKKD